MAELSPSTVWLTRLRERFGRRTLYALLGAVLALLALADLTRWQALQALDNRVGDALLRRDAARRAPPPDVVIVDIDQPSLVDPRMLELAGTWSWPRAIHAELLLALTARDPRAVVLDLILSPPDRLRPENDAALAGAVRDPRVFVPMILMEDSARQAPLALAPPAMGIRAGPEADPQARYGIDAPIALPPELWRTGYINFIKDADGMGRGTELGRMVQGWWLPHIIGRVADLLHLPEPAAPRFRLHWYGREFTRVPYAEAYLATQIEGEALPSTPGARSSSSAPRPAGCWTSCPRRWLPPRRASLCWPRPWPTWKTATGCVKCPAG